MSSGLNKLPVLDIEAGGKGDCFYFSLYEALTERGLMDDFIKSIGLTYGPPYDVLRPIRGNKKQSFNLYFRDLVANKLQPTDLATTIEILESNPQIQAIFTLQRIKPDDYKNMLINISNDTEFNPWFIDIYIRSARKTNNSAFLKGIQAGIKTAGNEAQQIETVLAKAILDSVGIQLEIVYKQFPAKTRISQYQALSYLNTSNKQKIVDYDNAPVYTYGKYNKKKLEHIKLPIENNGTPIIYVINSPQEGHYTYFSFNTYRGGYRKTRHKHQHKPIHKKTYKKRTSKRSQQIGK
jgi:hypothetical protein